ncbi:MAG TPA: hypothetical protein VL096_20315, partial [Pirellulaceae bacterium]|nr:hypothetical protein [Pirellulaceae bacterium]
MFGKPEWFKKKTWGWGLTPITRQGWVYTFVSSGIITIPFLVLLFSRGVPEAVIWLAAGVGMLVWDVRQIMQAMTPPKPKDVLYIGDDEPDSVQTRQLDLKLRHADDADAAWRTRYDNGAPIPSPAIAITTEEPMRALWLVPSAHAGRRGPKQFVDLQNDVTASDIQLAAREGYQSIEHVKRYTALGFGTDQGKLGNINGMAILARALGH